MGVFSRLTSSDGGIKLHIYLCEAKVVEDLRRELIVAQSNVDSLRQRVNLAEQKYAYEATLNNELCDLCRSSGVKFRSALETAKEKTGVSR